MFIFYFSMKWSQINKHKIINIIILMQKLSKLSKISCDIIYCLKIILTRYHKDIHSFIFSIFGEYKATLKKFEFEKIIKFGDPHITFDEIQKVYNQLKSNDQIVLVKTLQQELQNIKNRDDQQNNFEYIELNNTVLLDGLREIKQCLLREGPYELFNKFDRNKDECLDIQQLNFFLLGCSTILQVKDRRYEVIKSLLKNCANKKISKLQFFKVFRLENIAKRVTLKPPPLTIQAQNDRDIANKYISILKDSQKQIKTPKYTKITSSDKSYSPADSPIFSPFKPLKRDSIRNNIQPQVKSKKSIFHDISKSNDKFFQTQHPIIQQSNHHQTALKYYRLQQLNLPMIEILECYLAHGKKFKDPEGPKISKGQFIQAYKIFDSRFYLFQVAQSIFERQKQRKGLAQFIQPKDIIQGSIGDCYFLSSICSLVEQYPQKVSNLLLFDINPVGIYVVKLFNDGEWSNIILDDSFPCLIHPTIKPLFAKPHGKEIWVMLLEKAWAKIHQSYQNIDLGSSLQGLVALTGAPTQYYRKQQQNIKKLILQGFLQGAIITCSGSQQLNNLTQAETKALGLIAKHAYSVLKLCEIQKNNQKILLIKIRNPWGNSQWTGEWSFKSSKWDNSLRKAFNYEKNPSDGSFYMKWEDFEYYFGSITICYMIPNHVNSSHRIHVFRHKSNYIKFTILKKGKYTLSIYQESKRKYQNSINYELSQSRLIILKKGEDRYQYINSKITHKNNLHIQNQFEPGQYILSCKVHWNNFQSHDCIISSYGPQIIDFFDQKNREIALKFKKDMIQSFYKKKRGEKIYYSNIDISQAYRQILFDIHTGIGYIMYNNPTNQSFQSLLTLNSLTGIKVIKPAVLPINEILEVKSTKLIGFFISSNGFSYSLQQRIRFI